MDIESATWFESAVLNTAVPPDAFRGGMAAGVENDTFREVMAAVKREWNRSHPTLTLETTDISFSDAVWGLTPATPIAGYVHGQIFAATWRDSVPQAKISEPFLGVSGLTVKKVYVVTQAGLEWPESLYFVFNGMPIFFLYDSTLDSGNGGFVMWGLMANYIRTEQIECPASSESGVVVAGNGQFTFRLPFAFMFTGVAASLKVAQTSGSILTVDVRVGPSPGGGSIRSILDDKLTIDNGEKTSATAAIPATLLTQNADVNDDWEINVDVSQIGDGTAKGLKVYLLGYQQ